MDAESIKLLLQAVSTIATIIVVVGGYILIKKYKLEGMVAKAVKAAEVIFDIPQSGAEKKAWVKEKISALVRGKIPDVWLDILIEAAVEELHLLQGKITTDSSTASEEAISAASSSAEEEDTK